MKTNKTTYKIWWNRRGDHYVRTGLFHFDPETEIGLVYDLMEETADKIISKDCNVFRIELIDDNIDALVTGEIWDKETD